MKMAYYKINWRNEFVEEPFMCLIEVDENGFEQKKIEIYNNHIMKIASNKFQRGTFLSPDKFYFEDYNYESYKEKISVVEISRVYFNMEWNRAIRI